MRRAVVHYPEAFRLGWPRVSHDVRYGRSGKGIGGFVGFTRGSHERGEVDENGVGEGGSEFVRSAERRDVFSGPRLNSLSTPSH